MAVNAAWYRTNEEEYRGEFGLIDLSWRSVVVGIITSVLVLPVNYAIVMIFRRSKARLPSEGVTTDDQETFKSADKHHSLSSISSSAARALQPVMQQSILDQTIVNWQSLQQWAQKTWAKRHGEMTPGSSQDADLKPLRMSEEEEAEAEGDGALLMNNDADGSRGHSEAKTESIELEKLGSSKDAEQETTTADDRNDQLSEQENRDRKNNSKNTTKCLETEETLAPVAVSVTVQEDSALEQDHALAGKTPSMAKVAGDQQVGVVPSRVKSVGGKGSSPETQEVLGGMAHQGSSNSHGNSSNSNNNSSSSSSVNGGNSNSNNSNSNNENNNNNHSSSSSDSSNNGNNNSNDDDSTSPRSEHSTALSDLSSSTAKTTARIPRSTPRSQWSVTRSDLSGLPPVNIRAKKSCCVYLPSGCVYVAWVLCFVIIAGCSAVTVLYGFRFGRVKSIQWLQSLFFSAVQCVFISHPILIILSSVVMAIRYRKDLAVFDVVDDAVIEERVRSEMANIAPKAKDEEVEFSEGIAARQRQRYLRLIRPPQEKQLIEARNKTIKEKKASLVLSETTVFVIQFVLLMFIAFGKDQRPIFALNKAISSSLVGNGEGSFDEVRSLSDWWAWTENHFADTMFVDEWKNGQHRDSRGNDYIENSILLGHVNLRQLRVTDEPCDLPPPYSHVAHSCRYDYSATSRSRSAFGHNATWWHMRRESTGAHEVTGKHAYYDGNGFLVLLGGDKEDVLLQLDSLKTGQWTDQYTRALILEFTLFHPQSSLFTSVKLLSELPASGGVTTSHIVTSVYLYKYQSAFDNFVLACELMFIILTSLKLHGIVVSLLDVKHKYLRHVGHWCQLTQALLSLAYVICFIYRFILVWDTVDRLRSSYHEIYVDVAHVEEWDLILRNLIGFIACLVLLQMLRALRHRKPFAVFHNVYQHAALDIAVCGVIFLIWLSAYTCLGTALYATVSPHYSKVDSALVSTAGLFTRHNDPVADTLIADVWGVRGLRIFTASFMVFALGMLSAYIMAILNYHYKAYRREFILLYNTKESFLYYWDKFLVFFGLRYPQFPEEDESVLPAELRMRELEYQVDEMLFKMNALTGSSNLPEKPPMYFTDSDATYGTADDGLSSGGSEVREYDDERLGIRIHKIEENLLTHEPHLAQLIQLDPQLGPDQLVQEEEKKLRLQLELEIFRQLQMARARRGSHHRQLSATISGSTGYQASISQSSSNSSRGGGLLADGGALIKPPQNEGLYLVGPRNLTRLDPAPSSWQREDEGTASGDRGEAKDEGDKSRAEGARGGDSAKLTTNGNHTTVHPNKLLKNKLSFPRVVTKNGAVRKTEPKSSSSSSHKSHKETPGNPVRLASDTSSDDTEAGRQAAIVQALQGISGATTEQHIHHPLTEISGPRSLSHIRSASDGATDTVFTHEDLSGTSSSSGGAEVQRVLRSEPHLSSHGSSGVGKTAASSKNNNSKITGSKAKGHDPGPRHKGDSQASRARTHSADNKHAKSKGQQVQGHEGGGVMRVKSAEVTSGRSDPAIVGAALRKSKSHGQRPTKAGSGNGDLTPGEQFAFDNEAFDSDHTTVSDRLKQLK